MKKSIVCFLIFVGCGDNSSQRVDLKAAYYGTTGMNQARSAISDPDQNLFIAGGYLVDGGLTSGFLFIKVDSVGHQQWSRTFSDSFSQGFGYNVVATLDGGFLLAGSGGGGVMLVKTNGAGTKIWQKYLSGFSSLYSSVAEADSGFTLAGYAGSDLYLVHIDKSANKIWEKAYGGPNLDAGYGLAKTIDGGYIVVGERDNSGEFGSLYVVRTDANGDSLWTRSFPYDQARDGESVRALADGSFLIAGRAATDEGDPRSMIMKLDANGDLVWYKLFDKGYFTNLTETTGGFVFTGIDESDPDDDGNLVLVKVDGAGKTIFKKLFGTKQNDLGRAVLSKPGGGLIVVGDRGAVIYPTNFIFVLRLNSGGDY